MGELIEGFDPKKCAKVLSGILDNQRNRLAETDWLQLLQALKEEINDRILQAEVAPVASTDPGSDSGSSPDGVA